MTSSLPWRLRLPVFAAPMFLVSGPELVVAACKAGIIGAFPTTNARPIEELDRWLDQITNALDEARQADPKALIAPWCANLITHSSNQRLPQDLALFARYKPPIVVTALGSPKPVIDVVHGYGGLVIADVVNLTLARKAVAAGADGIACISAGAGGHTGHIAPFAFIAAVREFFDGLLVIGGGISDGAGIAGAIAAGADLVYMGTRFISAAESMAVPAYKQMVVDATIDSLVVTDAITGTTASWLKPSLAANGYDPDHLPAKPERRYGDENNAKRWRDVWAAGQGVGATKQIEPIAAIVDALDTGYRRALARLACLEATR
jgi:nitronate monooxygenase